MLESFITLTKGPIMLTPFTNQFLTIATKTVGKHTFELQIQAIPCEDYKIVVDYDYIISGPNWLSGFLKKQGYNEFEIFEYWNSVTIQYVNDAHESASDRLYNARCAAMGEY
jgi:hypothetical protein